MHFPIHLHNYQTPTHTLISNHLHSVTAQMTFLHRKVHAQIAFCLILPSLLTLPCLSILHSYLVPFHLFADCLNLSCFLAFTCHFVTVFLLTVYNFLIITAFASLQPFLSLQNIYYIWMQQVTCGKPS